MRKRRPLTLLLTFGTALILATAAACRTSSPATTTTPSATELPILVGRVSRAEIENAPGWEGLSVADYAPDEEALTALRKSGDEIEVLVVLATWCPDSQRELPRFFRVVDDAGIDAARIQYVSVDRDKRDPDGIAAQWKVQYVPTFIVLRDGADVGRIVERPNGTLEGDLVAILEAS